MRLYVNDVAVRDGFQIEKAFIPTATKVEVINQLVSHRAAQDRGRPRSSRPRRFPRWPTRNEVLAAIDRVPGVVYVALVPNIRGVQNAAAAARRPDEVNGVVSASETHNRANINRTHEQSLAELPTMVRIAHEAGMKITMSLSTTFGCPFEGHVHEDVVLRLRRSASATSASTASRFGDTTGMANPRQVRELMAQGARALSAARTSSTTRCISTTRAAWAWPTSSPASRPACAPSTAAVSGLGGCPFAPGATGNICTEDMVNMLEDMGYDTRIDLAKLLAVARRIPAVVGHDVPGQVMKAGPDARAARRARGSRGHEGGRRLAAPLHPRRGPAVARRRLLRASVRWRRTSFARSPADLGAAFSYKGVTPATALGPLGFDIGLEVTETRIENSALFARAGAGQPIAPGDPEAARAQGACSAGSTSAPSSPRSTDIDARLLGVDAALHARGRWPRRARDRVARLGHEGQRARRRSRCATAALDLMVSKRFTALTPYAGAGMVRIKSSAAGTGLAEESSRPGHASSAALNLNLLLAEPGFRGREDGRQRIAFRQARLAVLT